MLKVTLRKDRALDFLERMTKLVLPRVRDFMGVPKKSFDPEGNLNFGIPNYAIFPEFGVDDVSIPMGIQVTIVSTAGDSDKAQVFLEEMGFVFK
jgi:large subunit ribosomal protein L5